MNYNYENLTEEAKAAVSEELWKETVKRVYDTLNKFSDFGDNGYATYSEDYISLNLVGWANNKATRIEKFMAHPAYDASEPFKIVHEVDAIRNLDMVVINEFVNSYNNYNLGRVPLMCTLLDIFKSTLISEEQIDRFNRRIERVSELLSEIECGLRADILNGETVNDDDIYYAYYPGTSSEVFRNDRCRITREHGVIITKELIDKIKKSCKPHLGQKVSKFARKLITTVVGTVDEREFAKYADALNPTVFKRKAVLSIDPVDYLLMSHGNSWASCYWINKDDPGSYEGCYSNGTWSYMADAPTMIMYIVDKEKEKNYAELPKIFRQCVFFNENDLLINSRIYPSDRTDVREEFRGYAQQFVSEIWGIPNNWKVKETNYNGSIDNYGKRCISELIDNTDCFVGYNDPHYYELSVSVNKATELETPVKIRYGGKAYCPSCGDRMTGQGRYLCDRCDETGYECAVCGRHVSEDDAVYCEDIEEYTCSDCAFYCDYHDVYESRGQWGDNVFEVRVRRRWGMTTELWCRDAVDDNAVQCAECGE